jgi:uncharacterized caspase-like protein
MKIAASLRKCLFVAAVVCSVWCALQPAGAAAQERSPGGSSQSANGHYFALVIGNNAYQHVQRLQTAEADAKEVAAILQDQYGFQTKLLLNANRQQIISAINAFRRDLAPDSNLLIYYAGHGINDREIDKAYWLPIDARLDDNSNWISADDITSNIKGIPAKHVLIVSDSCYSGTLTRGLEASMPVPSERQRYLQKMFAGKSRTLMASGGNEPVADGGGGNHSIFANALLRGLKQMEKSEFTAGELFRDFVEESVAGRARQTPEYNPLRNSGHESGDFVFVRFGAALKMTEGATASAPVGPAQRPVDLSALDLAFWDSIKNSSDPQDFKAYLDKFPDGTFADLARRRAGTNSSKPPTGSVPAGNAPAGNAPAGNAPASNSPNAGERAVRLRSVRDYFLQLPEQYLNLTPARRAEVLRSEATIVDIKNGYISFPLGAHSRYALTVFKLDADSYLVAVSYYGPPNILLHTSNLSFLRYEGEQWSDVTKATLPLPFDPTLRYELPRYGTTITVTNQSGGKVFDLVWANGTFVVKRPSGK